MYQFRLTTLLMIVFASAILIYINTVPNSLLTAGHTRMNHRVGYGSPMTGFERMWKTNEPSEFTGIPSDAGRIMDPLGITVNILFALALFALVGFSSEQYFRRSPEDRLKLHYVTKMVGALAVIVVLLVSWRYSHIIYSWVQKNESIDLFITNIIIRSSLVLSIPSVLIACAITEWTVRLNKKRLWILAVAILLPSVILGGLVFIVISYHLNEHFKYPNSDPFEILPIVIAYGIYLGLFLVVTLFKTIQKSPTSDPLT